MLQASRVQAQCAESGFVDSLGGCWESFDVPLHSGPQWIVPIDDTAALVLASFNTNAMILDTQALELRPTAPMPFEDYSPLGVRLSSGQILAIGNRQSATFDPQTEVWSDLGHSPGITNGWFFAEPDGGALLLTSDRSRLVLRFEPSTQTWTTLGEPWLHDYSSDMVTYLPDGDLLVVGGFDGDESVADVTRFDRETEVWSSAAPLPVPRSEAATFTLGGQLMLIGGTRLEWVCFGDEVCDGDAEDTGPRNSAWLYDPENDLWSEASPLAQRDMKHSTVQMADGRWLSIGHRAQVFDPNTGLWTDLQLEPRPYLRTYPIVFTAEASVLVIDGYLYDGRQSVLRWTPPQYVFDPASLEASLCRITTARGFTLRPAQSLERAGTSFDTSRELELLGAGNCSRRDTLIFHVRDVGTGLLGWVFLTDSELEQCEGHDFSGQLEVAEECE